MTQRWASASRPTGRLPVRASPRSRCSWSSFPCAAYESRRGGRGCSAPVVVAAQCARDHAAHRGEMLFFSPRSRVGLCVSRVAAWNAAQAAVPHPLPPAVRGCFTQTTRGDEGMVRAAGCGRPTGRPPHLILATSSPVVDRQALRVRSAVVFHVPARRRVVVLWRVRIYTSSVFWAVRLAAVCVACCRRVDGVSSQCCGIGGAAASHLRPRRDAVWPGPACAGTGGPVPAAARARRVQGVWLSCAVVAGCRGCVGVPVCTRRGWQGCGSCEFPNATPATPPSVALLVPGVACPAGIPRGASTV